MSITLLEAVKSAVGESGLDVPTAVAGATDKTYFYCANASIRMLRQYQWQKLIKSGTITMTTATDYALPTDFWVYVPDTLWSEGGIRPVNMPTTPNSWTILKSGIGLNPGQFNCRFINDRLEVQNPQDGIDLRLEYISKNALTDSGGTAKAAFTADTDLCVLDEELFVRDLKWRIKKEKGIDDWQADKAEFNSYLQYQQGVNFGTQTLYPNGRSMSPCPPYTNTWIP